MPRHPSHSAPIAAMPKSVYSALAGRLARMEGETFPLHVGDTWMEPPVGTWMEDLRVSEYPGMHRYAPVNGLPELVSRLADRTTARTGLETRLEEVIVTSGGTGGLAALIGAIVEPGEEVMILAPYWPLIGGMVVSFNGKVVPVPILDLRTADELRAAIRSRLTPKTVAIYANTPNNPTGRILPRDWLEAIVEVAREANLWVIADEVYEDYAYAAPHTYLRPMAPERTFAAYSMSKAWGMAGNRCGYVVGPAEAIDNLRKVSTHTFYSTPTSAQLAALRALDEDRGDRWAQAAATQYQATGDAVAAILGVPKPEGSTFLFVDVKHAIREDGLTGLLERCLDRRLLVAPGPSFGPFPHHVRICYTCAPPDVVLRGAQALAEVLA